MQGPASTPGLQCTRCRCTYVVVIAHIRCDYIFSDVRERYSVIFVRRLVFLRRYFPNSACFNQWQSGEGMEVCRISCDNMAGMC